MGRDGYAGLAVLAASLALFWGTLGLERHPLVPVGPGFYPRIVLGITAAMALLLIVLDVIAHRSVVPTPDKGTRGQSASGIRPKRERDAKPNYRLVLVAFGIFTAYVLAMPWFGFRISTLLFLIAMQAAMEPPRNRSRWIAVVVLAVVTTVVTYFVFERYLHVLLPRGRWTDF